jgi:hypothetical protein
MAETAEADSSMSSNHSTHTADMSPEAPAPPSEQHIAALAQGVARGSHSSIEVRCWFRPVGDFLAVMW